MASTDVDIYRGSSLESRMRYADAIAQARGLLPAGIVTPPQALLIFEQASALGIPPITGLSQIHIIKGKPTLSAGLMTGLIRQAGHKLRVWVEGEGQQQKAIAELVRSDDPDFTFRTEFSVADATKAGLLPAKADSNWAKYQRAMLIARVTSEIARMGATDVFIGSIYTPEELDPTVQVDEQGEYIVQAPPQEQRANLTPETTDSSEIKDQPDEMPEPIRKQWFEAATALTGNRAGLDKMYKDIRAKGLMGITDPDDPEVTLVDYVVALGKAAAAAAESGADAETGEIIDAEIVEDEPPAVLDDTIDAESPAEAPAKPATRSRARKPANAAPDGASQG